MEVRVLSLAIPCDSNSPFSEKVLVNIIASAIHSTASDSVKILFLGTDASLVEEVQFRLQSIDRIPCKRTLSNLQLEADRVGGVWGRGYGAHSGIWDEQWNFVVAACRPRENLVSGELGLKPLAFQKITQFVRLHIPSRPTVVLPFSPCLKRGIDGHPVPVEISLGNPQPIVRVTIPGSGTGRFNPVWRVFMKLFGWEEMIRTLSGTIINTLDPEEKVWGFHFGGNVLPRHVFGEYYKGYCLQLDHFQHAEIHDHVPVSVLTELAPFRIVYLMRDPRAIYNSSAHYLLRNPVGKEIKESTIGGKTVRESLPVLIEGFDYITKSRDYALRLPSIAEMVEEFERARKCPNIYCVRYEDIRTKPVEIYKGVLKWLGLHTTLEWQKMTDEILQEIVKMGTFKAQSGDKFKEGDELEQGKMIGSMRKGIMDDWKNHFSPQLKEQVKNLVGEGLIRLGYERDLDW